MERMRAAEQQSPRVPEPQTPSAQTPDPPDKRAVRSVRSDGSGRCNRQEQFHCGLAIAAALLFLLPNLAFAWPQEWIRTVDAGIDPAEFAATWGVNPAHVKSNFCSNGVVQVYLVGSNIPANILWPGDKAHFTFQFTNLTGQAVAAKGKILVIQYETFTYPDNVFHIGIRKVANIGEAPI
jgi:hypothetical protein